MVFAQGAASGMILSHIVVLWITFSSLTMPDKPDTTLLPTSTSGCTNETFSPHFGPFPQIFNNSQYYTDDIYDSATNPAVMPAAHDL